MLQAKEFGATQRFCAAMVIVCWAALAADVVYLMIQARSLWQSLNGHDLGSSFGAKVITRDAAGHELTSASMMFNGSTVNLIFFLAGLCSVWALWSARTCFAQFARREVFARRTLRAMRGFAVAASLMQLAPVVVNVGSAMALTSMGVSPQSASMSLLTQLFASGAGFNLMLLAILLAMVAVLGRAIELAEDNAAIV